MTSARGLFFRRTEIDAAAMAAAAATRSPREHARAGDDPCLDENKTSASCDGPTPRRRIGAAINPINNRRYH